MENPMEIWLYMAIYGYIEFFSDELVSDDGVIRCFSREELELFAIHGQFWMIFSPFWH